MYVAGVPGSVECWAAFFTETEARIVTGVDLPVIKPESSWLELMSTTCHHMCVATRENTKPSGTVVSYDSAWNNIKLE